MKKDKKTKKYIFEYDMNFITIVSVILLVLPCFILVFVPLKKNFFDIFEQITTSSFVFVMIFVLLWMVLHEIIHGLSYQINGANSKNVKYGVVLEKGIFYCKCGEFINKKNIMISLMAPFVLIGVVTYIIGIIINSWFLIFLSISNISGAAGDITMFFFFLKRDKNLKFMEVGDTTTFCLETKEDLSNKKFFGVKLKKEIDDLSELKEKNTGKISITKASIIILLCFLIFMLFLTLLEFL